MLKHKIGCEIMKKILSLVLLFALTLSLTGCSLFYGSADELYYGFDIGYSEFYNEAFVAAYHWDGTDGARITIPEEYNDIPVTSFGGYIGRGFPMPTMIHFKDDVKLKNTLCPSATEWFSTSDAEIIWQLENCCFITYSFSLHVSKNIEKITDLSLDYFDVAKTVEEDITYHTVFVYLFTVTCDEENKHFYSKDGKLYFRENDDVVQGITYYDFDLDTLIP